VYYLLPRLTKSETFDVVVRMYASVHRMQFLEHQSDEQIVALARERNPEYFGDIVLRHQERIFRFVRGIVNNEQSAEDLTQQTFEKAFIALNAFDIKKKFTTWLYAIAKNEAFSYLRSQKIRRTVSLDAENPDDQTTLADTIADPRPGAESEMVRSADISKVKLAIQALKPAYRAAVLLYYVDELSYQEIAESLRLPINTVRTHIRRAKQTLEKYLSETF
jgi:RNA polymerase sigma-70 factor (ECF subfamily)